MKKHLTILPLFLTLQLSAQELYIPPDAEVTVTNGAWLTTGGDLANEGRLDIQQNAEMISHGDVVNQSLLFNTGTISLYSDWNNLGTYNGTNGEMIFLGSADQVITNTYLLVNTLTVNKIGTVTLMGDSIKILGELNFEDGVLTLGNGGSLIVESSASITHPLGSESYFDGEIISRGTSNRLFPVGDGGYFGTLELLDLTGINPEIGVSLTHLPPGEAVPGSDLIGVSAENLWNVELRSGSLDSTQLQIDFVAEDLENFERENNIRRRIESPVIAVSDSGATGPFRSLGVELLIDTDSLTTGILLAEEYAKFTSAGTRNFAIALAPLIGPNGQVFIPNVFSPKASDRRNQTFRVFGEHIADQPFRIEIYSRYSVLVYEADSFEEASSTGWDGMLPNGQEAFTGIYYVFVKYAFTNNPEDIKEYTGSILLKR